METANYPGRLRPVTTTPGNGALWFARLVLCYFSLFLSFLLYSFFFFPPRARASSLTFDFCSHEKGEEGGVENTDLEMMMMIFFRRHHFDGLGMVSGLDPSIEMLLFSF